MGPNRRLLRQPAGGNRNIASMRVISSSPTTDAIMKRRGDAEFDSSELQGVLSAMSSLIAGIFGAFAEGLALYAVSMAPELHYPTQDGEPPCRPRSQSDGSAREDTVSTLHARRRPVSTLYPDPPDSKRGRCE
jgi:hypothetical protein